MNENYTPENIFTMIDNQSVSREIGIKLIEDYGVQKQIEFVSEMQIIENIKNISEHLREMQKTLKGAIN